MPEPLAIAAGTVSILSGAITITGELGQFIRDLRNAPEHVRQAGASLESSHAILKPLNQMLLQSNCEDARDLTKPISELEEACIQLKYLMRKYPSRHGRASLLTFSEKFRWWRHKKDIRRLQKQIERAQGSITLSLSNRIFRAVGENAAHQAEMRQEHVGTHAEILHLMHELRDLAKRQRGQGSSVRSDDGHTLVEVSSRLQFTIDKWRQSVEPGTAHQSARSNADQMSSPRSSLILSPAPSLMGINSFKIPEYPLRPSCPDRGKPRRHVIASPSLPRTILNADRSNRAVLQQPTRQETFSIQDPSTLPARPTRDVRHDVTTERAAEDRDSGYQSVTPLSRTSRTSEARSSTAWDHEISLEATTPEENLTNYNTRSFADRSFGRQRPTTMPVISAPFDPNVRQQRYQNIKDSTGRVIAVPLKEHPDIHQVKSAPSNLIDATRNMDDNAIRTYIDGYLAGQDSKVAQTLYMSRSAMTLDRDRSYSSPEPAFGTPTISATPAIRETRNVTSSRGRFSMPIYRDPQIKSLPSGPRQAVPQFTGLPAPRAPPRQADMTTAINHNSARAGVSTSTNANRPRPSTLAPLGELPSNQLMSSARDYGAPEREGEREKGRRVARHSRERRRISQDENSNDLETRPARTPREAVRSSTAAALMASTGSGPDFGAWRGGGWS